MAADFLNTLQELIDSACDQLYAEKSLITKQAVKKIVLLHGSWNEEELDRQVPCYINRWRLHNLQVEDPDLSQTQVKDLQSQLKKYQAELAKAQQTINHLQSELLARNNDIKILRLNVIKELRGLLNG